MIDDEMDFASRRRQAEAQLYMNAEDALAPILVALIFLVLAVFFSASRFATGYADLQKGPENHASDRLADVTKRLTHASSASTASNAL